MHLNYFDFPDEKMKKVFVKCLYENIDKIKAQGNCKFSKEYKLWYFIEVLEMEILDYYNGFEVVKNPKPYIEPEKIYCNISYKNKNIAKEDGLKYNGENKKWFYTSNNINFNKLNEKYK
jgi:hypothetical protein